ncbi:MAG: TIGR04282 family arsenosugar biosynthesis glycosyltransferase [Cyclobacteriaceae bacterium]
MKADLLIIFYRNPELGQVKSRLAATVGEERALAIYLKLASFTRSVTSAINCDQVVYYSNFIDREDSWPNERYFKHLQRGDELGSKMRHAFETAFAQGYKRVCIIGTDCLELTSDILKEAFEALKGKDSVIGPAFDGGYYLLGMNRFIPEVFRNKRWSTDTVFIDTIDELKRLRCSYHLTPTLHDVDNEADLPQQLR